jgi:preprotein translocase subunit YajC
MGSPMLSLFLLFADNPPDAAPQSPGSPFGFLLPMAAIGLLFYFLMIRPMRKQEQDRQSLISSLKKNDKVVTSGGIIGIVAGIKEKEDEVTLKIDENSNVRLRVTKGSIARVIAAEEPAKDAKEGGA